MLTEKIHPGEFILDAGNEPIAKDAIVIAAAAGAMPAGQVLGQITASGKYTAYAPAASDGSEVAAGILWAGVPDLSVDQPGLAVVRIAEVDGALLTGLDTAARAALAAKYIIVR